jgi:uncharacterized protein YcbX
MEVYYYYFNLKCEYNIVESGVKRHQNQTNLNANIKCYNFLTNFVVFMNEQYGEGHWHKFQG